LIQHELNDWLKAPGEDGFLLDSFEPLNVWQILMKGPVGGAQLYENELFRLQVKFSPNYPLDPPEVIFLPEVPVHPHVYSNGHICLNILYDSRDGGWSPALTINKICHSLHSMLASNTDKARGSIPQLPPFPPCLPHIAVHRAFTSLNSHVSQELRPGLGPHCCNPTQLKNCIPPTCLAQTRPPGDQSYVRSTKGRSPKLTKWMFEDDGV